MLFSLNRTVYMNPDVYFYHGRGNLGVAAGVYLGINIFSIDEKFTGSVFAGPYEYLSREEGNDFGGVAGVSFTF